MGVHTVIKVLNELFANLIATLRKRYKLSQSDIIERQVRRIEQGDGSTLRLLAKAHGIELDAYLDAVTSAIANPSKNL